METKIIYETFHEVDENGKWYREFIVPIDFPVTYGFTDIKIPKDLSYPKWNWSIGQWEEDQEQKDKNRISDLGKNLEKIEKSLEDLSKSQSELNESQNSQLTDVQLALAEVYETILGGM